MALKKSMLTAQDFECTEAYIVVEKLIHEKNNPIWVVFGVYKDVAARDAGKAPFTRVNLQFALDLLNEHNLIAQAYLALKATADFANALDV